MTRGVTWSIFTLATICLIARMLSRLPALGGKGYGWDDRVIVFSWCVLIPSDIILDMMTHVGLGQDIWMVENPEQNITAILFWFYVSEYTYIVSLSSTKISILLLYLRMWPDAGSTPGHRWFHRCCILLIGVLFMYAALVLVVLGLECQPIDYAWTRWDGTHHGYCIDQNELIYASASLNILFDILTIILPVPRLLALQIPGRKKIAIVATFLVGLFVTLCSIIRLRYLAAFGNASNVTWLYNPIAIWSNVEINLGVVCACMPALAGLMQRLYIMVTGRELTTMRSGRPSASGMDGNDDAAPNQRYELEEKSHRFSAGTAQYYGRDDHTGKSSSRAYADDAVSLDDSIPPTTANEMPRMSEFDRAQQMIAGNSAAFSDLRNNSQ
ncbi:hypothetical protein AC579_1996 [Lecanosticta acicola]|uniref:Rhodopsin domain-containing protein n=1 Tax=Lecanosticta acicola TaxID=111012 RepID=A0AAI8YVN8_9PEZI|nr:hypothetical protein AC579_1996 [Lecanosticta acicola]